MKIKLSSILFLTLFVAVKFSNAQLSISSGATFNIQSGGIVTVQGDITSSADITGAGKVILKGSANQNVNMNGFTIPNLEMDNAANATMTGNMRIGTNVNFVTGKIAVGNFNARLAPTSTSTGAGTGKFFETNGTGFLQKDLSGDITGLVMPVGVGSDYLPVSITNTGSTYGSANIGVQAKGTADANRHPRTESFLLANWPITKTGITGGTMNAVATYVDPTTVVGTEADLRGIYWNGSSWSLTGGTQDAVTNTAGANITANTGELYAMNKFILLDSKVYLQAAFNTGTGFMNDLLRTNVAYVPGFLPASNLLPTSDPYSGNAQYSANANFTRVANTPTETVTASAFNDQAIATDNIVDWVFLELRTTAAPSTVIQTRSALLQRDGDIVDIDGTSPVYFKNVDAANYIISVKHRNHLAMAVNPGAFSQPLALTPNTKLDFTNPAAAANFLGAAGTNYFNNGSVNLMYAGNVNGNANVRYQGASNDRAALLLDAGSNELSVITGYLRGDLNMNRNARYQGASNDRAYLLSTILSSGELVVKSQILP